MKVAILQCNALENNPQANIAKIATLCQMAEAADLCLLPDGALTGVAPDCLIKPDEVIAALASAISANAPLLCSLYDQPFFLQNGAWRPVSGSLELNGAKIAMAGYGSDGADLSVDLQSRPFRPNGQTEWEIVLSGVARQEQTFAISANIVGGYGSLVYSGQSIAVNPAGELVARARAFSQDILLVDTAPSATNRISPASPEILEQQWQALCLGLADFVQKAGASRAILGLSGGMDSALVAVIAANSLGSENVAGVIMPSPYTSEESIKDAASLAHNLGIKTWVIPIQSMFDAFRHTLKPVFDELGPIPQDLTEENLQARIRGVCLMAIANKSGSLVLNTGNKSESAMGYCTLYGDTVGALAVIGDLFKTQVYALGRWYCDQAGEMIIPQNIFDKAPTAELRPGQKDTDSLPPYEELDPTLAAILTPGAQFDPGLARKVESFEFKRRQCPPPLLVSGLPLARLNQCKARCQP